MPPLGQLCHRHFTLACVQNVVDSSKLIRAFTSSDRNTPHSATGLFPLRTGHAQSRISTSSHGSRHRGFSASTAVCSTGAPEPLECCTVYVPRLRLGARPQGQHQAPNPGSFERALSPGPNIRRAEVSGPSNLVFRNSRAVSYISQATSMAPGNTAHATSQAQRRPVGASQSHWSRCSRERRLRHFYPGGPTKG